MPLKEFSRKNSTDFLDITTENVNNHQLHNLTIYQNYESNYFSTKCVVAVQNPKPFTALFTIQIKLKLKLGLPMLV